MNKIIKLLIFSDIFVTTGFGLIEPILAIFIKENLIGGTIFAAGIASTLYLITRCIVQLPFSRYVDNHDRKARWLIVGTFLIAMVPVVYIFASKIQHIYAAQILYGLGAGLAYPTWLGLFSTHLDRKHESFEWSLYSTLTGLGTAASAIVGASIAQAFGFTYTFILVGIMSVIGCIVLFWLDKKNGKKTKIKLYTHKAKSKA
ncbi:MFS transporter [Candidatus Woesearchaeota archaeon]|nr:MFS transporter [Candidatus Woesearchaeota archaeon]MBW3021861.1 MFS transporter [Candidatus Woesearchaeota archaeon]